jgi:putative transposase
MVRDFVTVKYDPHDLSFIYVKFDEVFERIPCVRNNFIRSADYEMYRWQRQQKGERDGTMTKEGAQSYGEITKQKNAEVKLTTQEKRKRKAAKGKVDYKKQAGLHGSNTEGQCRGGLSEALNDDATKLQGKIPKSKGEKLSKKTNVLDIDRFLKKTDAVDYAQPPTFYDTN